METITAAEVNKLRQQTGAGMMDCRKALIESGGDFEKAIDYLRKKGAKVAAQRSDRETREGVVVALTNEQASSGVILLLGCETDFVAKNQDFIGFARDLAQTALVSQASSPEQMDHLNFRGATLKDKVLEQVARIGEKISILKLERLEAPGVVAYIHAGNRMAVLLGLNKTLQGQTEAAARDIAMQIAAMNPLAVDPASVPAQVLEREKQVLTDQIRQDPKMAGKPDSMISRIAEGKLNAFFKEHTLMAQAFVKNGDQTVEAFLRSVDPELRVSGFKRVSLA